MFKYFDTHCHINLNEFDDDREKIIKDLEENNIGAVVVGVDYDTSVLAVSIANKSKNLFASIGLNYADNSNEGFDEEKYRELAKDKKVVFIGECGIDYFWKKESDDIERQKELFIRHVRLAIDLDLPLMVHSRPSKNSMDAYEDILEILESYKGKVRGNIHFFAGSIDIAKRFLDLGFTMSFTGVITFTHDYDEVIKYLPLESILSETDAPFVAPVPYRGKRAEPGYVSEVVAQIAKIKDIDVETVRLSILKSQLTLLR